MLRREQSRLPGKRKETMLNRNMRNTAILLVVFLAVYMFGNYFAEKNLMSGSGSSSYSYERLESDIAKNKVKSIEVVQNAQVPTGSAIVKLNDGEKKVAHVTDVNKVIDLAQQYKVSCQVDDVKSSDAGWLSMILPWIVIGVIMMFMFGMISRASGGGGGGNKMMNFGKSRAKMQDPESQNIRFDQVAGLQEEKEELKEIVDFLKSPQKYIEVGARIPKGVILVGPPGTGKTLLAKAVSGEAGVPFFSISGSDFVEMFVGVGASRVRDLFEDAKRNAPCIEADDGHDGTIDHRGHDSVDPDGARPLDDEAYDREQQARAQNAEGRDGNAFAGTCHGCDRGDEAEAGTQIRRQQVLVDEQEKRRGERREEQCGRRVEAREDWDQECGSEHGHHVLCADADGARPGEALLRFDDLAGLECFSVSMERPCEHLLQ